MSQKFIPNGDADFAEMARLFATQVGRAPGQYFVAEDDVRELGEAVAAFGRAYQATHGGHQSPKTTAAKRAARKSAEAVVRRIANQIRTDERIPPEAKKLLGLKVRTGKPRTKACPAEPPRLTFVRAVHEGTGSPPRHVLKFGAWDYKASRPAGAVRLELFVELLAPDVEVPASPVAAAVGNGFAGRLWYWRSYTKNPIELVPPLADRPMRVVYWARWAGSSGDVGPLSAPAVGWLEGGSAACLPGGVGMGWMQAAVPKVIETLRGEHAPAPGSTPGSVPGSALGSVPGGLPLPDAEDGAGDYVVTVMQVQPRMLEARPTDGELDAA